MILNNIKTYLNNNSYNINLSQNQLYINNYNKIDNITASTGVLSMGIRTHIRRRITTIKSNHASGWSVLNTSNKTRNS